MFDVDIEESGEQEIAKLMAAVRRFGPNSERKLWRAVEREKTAHAYTNRTGTAEVSTEIVRDQGLYHQQGDVSIIVRMGAPYASYLQGEWSQFDKNVRRTLNAIHGDAEMLK